MGIVYEAMQISLGRRVALKVLPFASTLDARQLQRFKNEAQAAAGLHHTNIVPVFATGCERGVHYYAMQFIDGQTVAALIAGLRAGPTTSPLSPADEPTGPDVPTPPVAAASTQPSACEPAFFRTVAVLGVQAAEALEHAHQLGVIHRDIKPANLLVENGAPLAPAGHGDASEGVRLWITDFGLAHCQSQSGLTLTGDLVGTLRYMSPEQALAKRVVVDQRTDIYSLGVTLYELLTLEPAFRGSDRQELLRQIAFEEPRPPRRINKAIPVELETIVLKAMEKNPAERYGTAQELADDLERWLKDEPIRARRPSVVQRLQRWSRRHKPVVTGLAAGLLTLLVVGVVLAFGYQRRLAETDRVVTAALTQADTFLVEGDKQIDHPERWQATAGLALGALEKAEDVLRTGVGTKELAGRVRHVREAVDVAVRESHLLVELNRIRLEEAAVVKEGHFDEARAVALYAKALGDYGIDLAAPEEAAARVQASRLREPLLSALVDWLGLTQDEAERQRVAKVYQLALPADSLRPRLRAAVDARDGTELEKLAKEPRLQELPPTTLRILADELAAVKEWAAAERLLRAGLERKPGDFWLNHNLGMLLKNQNPPRPGEAMHYLTVALALRSDSSGVHLNLGNALRDKGDLEGAIRRYRAALEIDRNYATAHRNLGDALNQQGKVEEAMAAYNQAIACYRQDIALDRKNDHAFFNLGALLCDQKGDYDGAVACFCAVIDLQPNDAKAWFNRGNVYSKLGRWDQAVADCSRAIDLDPKLAAAWGLRGASYFGLGQWDQAVADCSRAIELNAKHAKAWFYRGTAYLKLGRWDQAVADLANAIELDPKDYEAWNNRGTAYSHLGQWEKVVADYSRVIELDAKNANAWNCRGAAYSKLGQLDKAVADYSQATDLDPKYKIAWYNSGLTYCNLGQLDQGVASLSKAIGLDPKYASALLCRGAAYSKLGQWDKAIADCSQAIDLDPKNAIAWSVRAASYDKLSQPDKALADYSRAIELDPKLALVWYSRGNVYRDLRQPAKAIGDFSRAIELDPKYLNAWNNRGTAYCDGLRQPDKGLADFSRAIELDPKFALAWGNRGNAYRDLGQWDKALTNYSKAIELDPKDAKAWGNRGVAYAKLGQPDKALADYSKVIELDPKDAKAWNNRGNVYRNLGQPDKALADFSRAIELDPKLAPAWGNRGNAYRDLGQWDKAIADFSKAIDLDPKHDIAINALAWQLGTCPDAKLRNSGRAVELAKKAVQLAPEQGAYWNTLGVAHYRAGDWQAAVAALNKSVELGRGVDASDRLFLGMAHQELGNPDEARKWYDQAVQWLEKHKPALEKDKLQAEELLRLRSEAEDVLQLKTK
jgi:tetratricopeptide (TPR) repeat protein